VDPTFSVLDTPALWALVVGFITPPIISVIQENKWSARTKALVAFAFYLMIAAVAAWFAGLWTVPDVGRLWLLIFLSASTSYRNFWKPTGISPAIENATSSVGTSQTLERKAPQ
jgi:hypothetical protein